MYQGKYQGGSGKYCGEGTRENQGNLKEISKWLKVKKQPKRLPVSWKGELLEDPQSVTTAVKDFWQETWEYTERAGFEQALAGPHRLQVVQPHRLVLHGVVEADADLLGFHVYEYARHFLHACTHLLGGELGVEGNL